MSQTQGGLTAGAILLQLPRPGLAFSSLWCRPGPQQGLGSGLCRVWLTLSWGSVIPRSHRQPFQPRLTSFMQRPFQHSHFWASLPVPSVGQLLLHKEIHEQERLFLKKKSSLVLKANSLYRSLVSSRSVVCLWKRTPTFQRQSYSQWRVYQLSHFWKPMQDLLETLAFSYFVSQWTEGPQKLLLSHLGCFMALKSGCWMAPSTWLVGCGVTERLGSLGLPHGRFGLLVPWWLVPKATCDRYLLEKRKTRVFFFSSMECHWVYQPHSRAGPTAGSHWPT